MAASPKPQRKVLLDANFLALPQQLRIDVVERVKDLVPGADVMTIEQVKDELGTIRTGRIGLEMIKRGIVRVEPWESEGNTDKAIIEYALENQAIVATNDKELKKQLRKLKVPVIQLRARKKLEIEGVTI